jgi:hypothetical protein
MDFLGIRTLVKDWINRPDLESQIPTFVNMAMRRIERENNYACMEKKHDTTVLNDDGIAIPSDFKAPKSYRVASGDNWYNLQLVSIDTMKASFAISETGPPTEKYAVDHASEEIVVGPYPDTLAYYTIEFIYYGYTPDMSDDADTNFWTTTGWEALLYGALVEASGYLFNDARLVIWQAKYLESVKSVKKADTESTIFSGGLQIGPTVDVV